MNKRILYNLIGGIFNPISRVHVVQKLEHFQTQILACLRGGNLRDIVKNTCQV